MMTMMSENCIDKKESNKRTFNMRCLVDDREKKVKKAPFFSVINAPFNNMRTLKFKAKPTNALIATLSQCSASPSNNRLLPSAL